MKKILLTITVLLNALMINAQEIFVNADFVSSYIWRGMEAGNACVQPSLGVTWKGLTVYAWGSTEFRNKNNEIDLSVEYECGALTLYANNYFTQTEEEPFRYFNYKAHSTGHTFEVGAGWELSERVPLSISWYTTFAGNDFRESGRRAWSSYCEMSYPFQIKEVKLSAELGFTPWEGMYADKCKVTNVGISATKEIPLTSHFSLPIFGKLIANPHEEQFYFVIGFQL